MSASRMDGVCAHGGRQDWHEALANLPGIRLTFDASTASISEKTAPFAGTAATLTPSPDTAFDIPDCGLQLLSNTLLYRNRGHRKADQRLPDQGATDAGEQSGSVVADARRPSRGFVQREDKDAPIW
jgi:hypothetical protein